MGRKLALIIGNSDFEDSRLARLVNPTADVQSLAEVLRDPEIGGFDEVTTLVNQPATAVRRAVAGFFVGRGRDDLLLLYFSGHGIRDDRGQLFLAVKDTEHSLLRGTAIPAAFITEEMDGSRSRRQVLILDCCQSGAFSHGMKGAPGASVGTAATFEGTGSGRVVLTATDATQYAWEGDRVVGQAENSVFTHFLIQGLRTGEADADADGRITLDELYNYVYDQVIDETPLQTPGKWSYGQQGELVIARNPRPVVKPVELPPDLQQTIDDPRPWVREGAVRELDRLVRGGSPGLALAAREALKRLAEDDSRRVAAAAAESLAAYEEPGRTPEKARGSNKTVLSDVEPLEAPEADKELSIQERTGEERRQPAREKVGSDRIVSPLAQAGSVTGEPAGQAAAAEETPGTLPPFTRKLTGALPRWAIWVGLLLLGGSIVAYIANQQVNPGGTPRPTPTLSATSPAGAPAAGRIAFYSIRNNQGRIYVVNPDGSGETRLTNNTANDYFPAWSSDGERIAFVGLKGGNSEIFVMNADDSRPTQLTDNAWDDRSPAWSPDGTRIAFVSDRDGSQDVYLMNADGSGETRLTNDTAIDRPPAWSADGTQMAYVSDRDGNSEIYRINADGSGETRLTNNNWDDLSPTWSPDGARIAFSSNQSGSFDIYGMNSDGSGVAWLTSDPVDNESPAWSPGGAHIAFVSDRDGNKEIYLMNSDGSGQTRLTTNSVDDNYPAWLP